MVFGDRRSGLRFPIKKIVGRAVEQFAQPPDATYFQAAKTGRQKAAGNHGCVAVLNKKIIRAFNAAETEDPSGIEGQHKFMLGVTWFE